MTKRVRSAAYKVSKYLPKIRKTELKGALIWGVVDGIATAYALPEFYTLPPPLDVVPSLGKGLIPASAAGVIVVGKKKHKPKVELMGRGAAIYGMGSFVSELSRRVMLRNYGLFNIVRTRPASMNGRVALSGALQGRYGSVSSGFRNVAVASGVGKYGSSVGSKPMIFSSGSTYPRR